MRQKLIADEEKRMKTLRFIVDLTQSVLMQSDLSWDDAWRLIENTRRAALTLFPGKDDVFDLIYAPRFRRIIKDRYAVPDGTWGNN